MVILKTDMTNFLEKGLSGFQSNGHCAGTNVSTREFLENALHVQYTLLATQLDIVVHPMITPTKRLLNVRMKQNQQLHWVQV